MLREGASVGVHLVLAGDRSLVSGRMGTFTEAKLVLRLSDKTDFSLAGINPRSVPDELPPGRGFRSESGIESQVALLDGDATAAGQAAALAAIAAEARTRDEAVPRGRRPFRVDVLPARLSFDQAWELRVDTDRPAVVGTRRCGRRRARGARAGAQVRRPVVRRGRTAAIRAKHGVADDGTVVARRRDLAGGGHATAFAAA